MRLFNLTKNKFKKNFDTHIATGGLQEEFGCKRKLHKRRRDILEDGFEADLGNLSEKVPSRSMRPQNQHRGISEGPERGGQALDGWGRTWAPLQLPAGRGACPQLKDDPGVVLREPPGVLVKGGLASNQPRL
jgi:hypothetical protein